MQNRNLVNILLFFRIPIARWSISQYLTWIYIYIYIYTITRSGVRTFFFNSDFILRDHIRLSISDHQMHFIKSILYPYHTPFHPNQLSISDINFWKKKNHSYDGSRYLIDEGWNWITFFCSNDQLRIDSLSKMRCFHTYCRSWFRKSCLSFRASLVFVIIYRHGRPQETNNWVPSPNQSLFVLVESITIIILTCRCGILCSRFLIICSKACAPCTLLLQHVPLEHIPWCRKDDEQWKSSSISRREERDPISSRVKGPKTRWNTSWGIFGRPLWKTDSASVVLHIHIHIQNPWSRTSWQWWTKLRDGKSKKNGWVLDSQHSCGSTPKPWFVTNKETRKSTWCTDLDPSWEVRIGFAMMPCRTASGCLNSASPSGNRSFDDSYCGHGGLLRCPVENAVFFVSNTT